MSDTGPEAVIRELNKLDAVVHELGIEDSFDEPVECIRAIKIHAEALQARCKRLEAAQADDLRKEGWAVVCHNDYRWNGENYTFWSFTKGNRFIKGEGRTDIEALNEIRAALSDTAQQDCPDCEGRGSLMGTNCDKCRGTGRIPIDPETGGADG